MSLRDYAVVLYRDHTTGLYVADVPSLSVSTYGDSKREAMAKVKEAIQVTIEGLQAVGQPLPGSSSDDESVEVRRVKVTV